MRKFLLIALLSSLGLDAQTWNDSSALIDGSINRRYPRDQPGCQLSISRNNKERGIPVHQSGPRP
jgi:hypothetical protein